MLPCGRRLLILERDVLDLLRIILLPEEVCHAFLLILCLEAAAELLFLDTDAAVDGDLISLVDGAPDRQPSLLRSA